MTYQGRPLERWPIPHGKASSSALYHWRSIARWRGLSWEYFRTLDPDAMAGYIAEYETATSLEALEAEQARKEAARRARRTGGRSRV